MHNRFNLTPKVAKHIREWNRTNTPYEVSSASADLPAAAASVDPSETAETPSASALVSQENQPSPETTPETDASAPTDAAAAASLATSSPSTLPPVPSNLAPLAEVNTARYTVTRTDVGRVRSNNQDTVINEAGLIGVADGMGGHNGGEVASSSARRHMAQALSGQKPSTVTLSDAILRANLEIFEQATRDRSLDGMGTTLTILWPAGSEILIGHVGDSRAYLYRDSKLTRQTTDHSMVAEMVRSGLLTEEQAAVHPMRNYITRAVGTEVTVEPEILRVPRRAGDRWLVCSDGLHGLVSDSRLAEILAEPDADRAADLLLQEALENGGRDNISLTLFTDGEVTA